MENTILEKLKELTRNIANSHNWLEKDVVVVSARALTPHEAIGVPERDDYPILVGKEVMIEATFQGSKGQAFTDQTGSFKGSVQHVFDMDLKDNFERAIFVAVSNAIFKEVDAVSKTVHCKNEEPKKCATELVETVRRKYGNPKIAFVGYQPGMLNALSKHFKMRVVDLDPDNIGKNFGDAIIENVENTVDVLHWADVILATGSTVVNETMQNFITQKPVLFYGITGASALNMMGLEQYCAYGK